MLNAHGLITRRFVAEPALAALGSLIVGPRAFAAPVDKTPGLRQAEWLQSYDAGAVAATTATRTDAAILSQQTIMATEAAIAQLQQVVAQAAGPCCRQGRR